MKRIMMRLLVLSLWLGGGITVQASDPQHFIVFDMPEEQIQNQWGRIPWHGMPDEEVIFLTESTFQGDSLRLLVIMVEWDDRPGTLPRETFDTLLFSRNILPDGSLADYIHEVSYGAVELSGDVLDWYNAGPVYSKQYAFSELFPILDPVIDYSLYDGNKDKKVDAICFLRSGTGEEDSQNPIDIWSYASVTSQGWGRYDNTQISGWHTCPEFKPLRDQFYPMQFSGQLVRSGIRVFVHELGHNLGLPDLYDMDDKLNTATYSVAGDDNDHPVVDWDPMGYYGYGYLSLGMITSNHYSPWSKIQLGWIEPLMLNGEYNNLVIYNVETTADSSLYKIPINGSTSEYFLLEYRNPNSVGKFDKFDSDFSSWFFPDLTFGYDRLDRGLAIWHIDDDAVAPTEWMSTNRGTPFYPHYTVAIEDAGYNPSKPVTYNPEGRETDSAQWWYPWETRKGALFSDDVAGQSEFGPQTVPNSDGYYGPSGIYVRVDSIVGEKMYLYVNTDVDWLECCELRGDVNDDGLVTAMDIAYLNAYLLSGGDAPPCLEQADVDGNGEVDTADLQYLINYMYFMGPEPVPCLIGGIAPTFTSTPVTYATYHELYTYNAHADAEPAATYSLVASPSGMTIDGVSGLVEWTPDDTGNYNVTISASNSWGIDYQSYTITVHGLIPVFTSAPDLQGVAGELYLYDADADGYPVPTYSLATAPEGMSIDNNSGLIQWTPVVDDDYDVVIEASNSAGMTPQSFTISIAPAQAPMITSVAITGATYNQQYSYDVEATGNPAPVFALATYPSGMTIDSQTGLIEWTPADTGHYAVVVEASNNSGTDIQSFTITVVGTLPVFTSTPITTATYMVAYSYDANVDAYPAATFALTTSPTGMTIDPLTGLVGWTPTDIGDYPVVIEATNSGGTAFQSFTITVAGVAPVFISDPPLSGAVGSAYLYDSDANGYPTPTYALTTYPAGMTVDPATGLIQWTPEATGDYGVVLTATNAYGAATQNFTITVAAAPEAPVIVSTPITSVTVGQPYVYDVEATGFPAPTYRLITLPSGMTINSTTGIITWTPGTVGDYSVLVEALNVNGADSQSFTLSVVGVPPTFTSTPILTAVYGVQYSYDANATGNPAPTFALATAPAGMTINSSTGLVRWTPSMVGDFSVVIEAINVAGMTPQSYTLSVSGTAPLFTSTPVTTGTYGQLYTYDANTSGYPAATFSLTTYPTGMTIDPATGVIQWTPPDTGSYDVTVEAVNDYGTDSQSYVISVGGVIPSFTSTPIVTGSVGALYVYDVNAAGYPAPTYSLTTYPSGMTIDPVTGLIEWTPDTEGGYSVVVEAANVYGTTPQSFTINVSGAPTGAVIISTPVTTATIGQQYVYDVEATGVPAPTYALLTSPSTMKINATTGVITWTPNSVGDYNVMVRAANINGADTQSFVITVIGVPPSFTSTPILTATYNVLYEYDANASGLPSPTFSLVTAPAGMTINKNSGVVRWTPADTGHYEVVVQATNIYGSAQQSFTVVVGGVAPVFNSTPVLTGTVGVLYSYDANATGYPAASYSLTTYPDGMTIDPITGLIEWTPVEAGDQNVVVEAVNTYGTDTQSFTISVYAE